MSIGSNLDRLTYRSSKQTTKFAWRTVILAIVFGSAVFVILPLTASKPTKKEKELVIAEAPERVRIKIPEKEKIFERKNITNIDKKVIQDTKPVPPSAPQPVAAPIALKLDKVKANVELTVDLNIKPQTDFKVEKLQVLKQVTSNPIEVKQVAPDNTPKRDYNAIFSENEVDTDAQVIRRVNPIYPRRAWTRKITGRVVIQCVISKEGRILDPKITHSDPKGFFEKSCLDTVNKVRYRPAMLDGKPVAQRLEITYSFGFRE